MNLLNLVEADGIQPKRVAATKGGEYHSPCPGCGGRDRFIIWDKLNRYFCRRCQKKGDCIQYLRDFHSLSFSAACARLGIAEKLGRKSSPVVSDTFCFAPKAADLPSLMWRQSALEFIQRCHRNLFNFSYAVGLFLQRGFTPKTMKACQVGWNPRDAWVQRSKWGLSEEGELKKIWLPKGLVLPTFHTESRDPIKVKIRRDDWEGDNQLPKYVEVSGGMQTFSQFGSANVKPIVLLESEFDAMILQQIAGDLVACMALGGASKRPDAEAHRLLIKAPLILFCLDVDSAGAIAYRWWSKVYPHLKLWLPPIGKSPGDAHTKGVDLRSWISSGLNLREN